MRRTTRLGVIGVLSLVVLLAVIAGSFAGCNKQLFDTTYNFNYAYVVWPDGTSEKIKIRAWNDYDGEQLQIKTENGEVYVFHSANCVLASE